MLNFDFPSAVLDRIALVERPPASPGTDHLVVMFDNDFGVSILRSTYTYGGESGLFEIAIVRGEDKALSEGDPIGQGEIIGWLTDADVIELADRVSRHTAEAQKAYEDLLELEEIVMLFESIRVAILRTDGEEDPRNEDNPALLKTDAKISPEARQAVRSTTELFIRKIEEQGQVVPTYLIEVLADLS